MEDIRNTYKIRVGQLKVRKSIGDLRVDGRIDLLFGWIL
jgi:hypothetical protein